MGDPPQGVHSAHPQSISPVKLKKCQSRIILTYKFDKLTYMFHCLFYRKFYTWHTVHQLLFQQQLHSIPRKHV